MLTNLALGLLAASAVAYLLWRQRGDTSPTDARTLVQQGGRLVDVRSRAEFAGGHIDGALNIPVDELPRRMGEIGAKDRAIVVYCLSGTRSARAAGVLKQAGFSRVHNLGAMTRWPRTA